MKGWVTLQLTEKGEIALEDEPRILEEVLRKFFKSDLFFPVYYNTSQSYDNKIYLFKGYIFVKYSEEEIRNYQKISNTQYFIGPLRTNKKLFLTPNSEILKLKKKLDKMSHPDVSAGDIVRVVDGKYKNLTAFISEYYEDTKEADLTVKLKCMSILVPRIPISCLRKDISKDVNKKKSLQKRILSLLEDYPKGLTRKEIISKIDLTENEKKRVSTSLSRAMKKKIIESELNSTGRSIFFLIK